MFVDLPQDVKSEIILESTKKHGCTRIQNLHFQEASELETYLQTFPLQFQDYRFGQSPRTKKSPSVYTTTEYPAKALILPHHELSYSSHPPRFLFFYCQKPASEGGETTLVDGVEFYQILRTDSLFDPIFKYGLQYQKTMPSKENANTVIGFGKSWQEHFETEDKAEVEFYLNTNDIQWKWLSDGQLQTRNHRSATRVHPDSKERIWFSQPTLWHLSCFGAKGRFLISRLPIERYPVHIRLGNGDELNPKLLQRLQTLEQESATPYSWSKGELLVVDNWRFAHGRMPFSGERVHWIAMGDWN